MGPFFEGQMMAAGTGDIVLAGRCLVEELIIRGMDHNTLIDRREFSAEEWKDLEISDEETAEDAALVRADGQPGRVDLPEGAGAKDIAGSDEICSVLVGVTEQDILVALWRIYRYLVMERSYGRYRSLADPIQGKARGQTWMLFDLMMEEALGEDPEERGPAIAYETMFEHLEDRPNGEEKAEFTRLMETLEPGKISVEMRKFLAGLAKRYEDEQLLLSKILSPYL